MTNLETRSFEAEVSQVLKLMIHSMYSNKEVFLRELISNASDAMDKLRFEALSNENLFEGDTDLQIRIELDEEARTLTLSDNGIGMSRDEVASNIGTIARSGTREFVSRLTGDQSKDAQLIGQFGVGFYSAFIVADRVVLTTRRAGESEGVRWESRGEGDYTIETVEKAGRGTEIVLHLREEEDEFLNAYRVKSVIRKYSDHIPFPVILNTPAAGEDGEAGEETVNQASALWMRSKSELSDEEYNEFYKHVAHDFTDPLTHVHSKIEGRLSYTLLLYTPARRPFDMGGGFDGKNQGIKLYVKRVFITDDAELFMPRYLRWVRGVLDSDDLPLNVSREMLQDNRVVASMRKTAVKRTLAMLSDLSKDEEKYQQFWRAFGAILKEGVVEDADNREEIAKLLRFSTTRAPEGEVAEDAQTVSLDEYVGRMVENQDKIYYVTAATHAAAKNSPHLEVFGKKGIEVLLLTDNVDEWVVSHLDKFDGKDLQAVTSAELDLGELEDSEEKEKQEEVAKSYQPLVEKVKEVLGDRVGDVRISHRLTESPACLVTEEGDMSTHMRRVLAAAGQDVGAGRPILELNPNHPVVEKIQAELEEAHFGDWTHVLFDQARLSEGSQLENPAMFVKRLNDLMLRMMAG